MARGDPTPETRAGEGPPGTSRRAERPRTRAVSGEAASDVGLRDAGRPDVGRLHARLADRTGRDGQRLARPAERRALRRRRRGQAPQREPRGPCRRRALPAGRIDPGPTPPSPHRAPRRRGRVAERPALSRARAGRGRAHRPVLREPRSRRREASGSFPGRPRGGRPRARQPDRASRHQAVQRPRRERRTGEAPRFRHREASRGGIRHRRSHGADARRRPRAHAGVRRAGTGDRRHGDDRDRRLRPRRAPLRSSDRKASGGGVAAIARRPPRVDRRNGASNVPPTPRRPTWSAVSSGATWTRSWRRR